MLFAPSTGFSAASPAAEVTPSARELFTRSRPELHWRMPTNRAPETGGPLLAGFCKGGADSPAPNRGSQRRHCQGGQTRWHGSREMEHESLYRALSVRGNLDSPRWLP